MWTIEGAIYNSSKWQPPLVKLRGSACLCMHYQTLIETYKCCPIPIVIGDVNTGKTTACRMASKMMGMNHHLGYAGERYLPKQTAASSFPVFIDDAEGKDIEGLMTKYFNGGLDATCSFESQPKTCPIVTANWFVLDKVAGNARAMSRALLVPFSKSERRMGERQCLDELERSEIEERAVHALPALVKIGKKLTKHKIDILTVYRSKVAKATKGINCEDRIHLCYGLLLFVTEHLIRKASLQYPPEAAEVFLQEAMVPRIKTFQSDITHTELHTGTSPDNRQLDIPGIIMQATRIFSLGELLMVINPHIDLRANAEQGTPADEGLGFHMNDMIQLFQKSNLPLHSKVAWRSAISADHLMRGKIQAFMNSDRCYSYIRRGRTDGSTNPRNRSAVFISYKRFNMQQLKQLQKVFKVKAGIDDSEDDSSESESSDFDMNAPTDSQSVQGGSALLAKTPVPAGNADPGVPAGNADPGAPACYADPGVPAGNADPGVPAGNADPGAPARNADPGAPACNADPGVPAGNADPGVPAGNADPGVSAGNADPGAPARNADPGAPACNADPGVPAGNADPGVPAGNADPGVPAGNADPGAPARNADPGAPACNADPGFPARNADPGAPVGNAVPGAPARNADPGAPARNADPGAPACNADPGVPAGNADPGVPAGNADPGVPAGNADPGVPARNADPGVPAGNADLGVPARNADPGAPVGNADPGVPACNADPGAPARNADPGAPARNADRGAPACNADPGVPAGNADPGVPARNADPGAPVGNADRGAPARNADPGAPAGNADPGAPAGNADPGVPAGNADPGAPACNADPGAPAGNADPGVPARNADPGAPAGNAYRGAPACNADPGVPARNADPGAPAGNADPGARAGNAYRGAPACNADPGAPACNADPGAPVGNADPGAPARNADPGVPAGSADPGAPVGNAYRGAPAGNAPGVAEHARVAGPVKRKSASKPRTHRQLFGFDISRRRRDVTDRVASEVEDDLATPLKPSEVGHEQKDDICHACMRFNLRKSGHKQTNRISWIACTRCDKWFHQLCVNLKITRKAAANFDFICSSCLFT
ncbi:collagen alpha-1(III) chain-like [Patiria miniata]|uniref:PHD-type domain-containing protein n=1 Tax=Patiria miniata TaxID=46514 RepID=A0A914AS55_PATMI|nr:collagen alpha-1(III) chain-like [Patiria miniata]